MKRSNEKAATARNDAFKALVDKHLNRSKFRSVSQLAKEIDVPVSSISMVISGERNLREETAVAIAKALAGSEWKKFAEELLQKGQKKGQHLAEKNGGKRLSLSAVSAADRVRTGEPIGVGYIVNPPFVDEGTTGFAVEFFDHLSRLMGCRSVNTFTIKFSDMEDRLNAINPKEQVDIVVTALLPTFQRSSFMSFSPPLPFLKASLSGLITKEWHEKGISASDLFGKSDVLGKARFLLISGEVGEEFARCFFSRELRKSLRDSNGLMTATETDPDQIASKLLSESVDIFLADFATCKAVKDELNRRGHGATFAPIKEDNVELNSIHVENDLYPQLGTYPIVFGLRKDDPEWAAMIRDSFTYLLTEGIRAVMSLYGKYFDTTAGEPYFNREYRLRDESVPLLTHLQFQKQFPPPPKARRNQSVTEEAS